MGEVRLGNVLFLVGSQSVKVCADASPERKMTTAAEGE